MRLIIDIHVHDLDRAVRFYTEVLGLACRTRQQSWAAIAVGDAEIHLYVHSGTSGHVEFYTDDIDRTVRELAQKGVRFVFGKGKPEALSVDAQAITAFPWGRAAFFQDSEGNEMAIVQDYESGFA
jgi:predicted enzyme related to lactoylglutathione lyase